ncbi:hypothetical protein G6F50_016600 [Rhizopus delemar]|uniref:Uncharacterized protein n=1 Tax=Rhizopus delemar TaxID=936053 RepID=A0A9P6XSL1_9FUNG|nr:hypothetical protein G6F50_016600 [Rhizopus delemar]
MVADCSESFRCDAGPGGREPRPTGRQGRGCRSAAQPRRCRRQRAPGRPAAAPGRQRHHSADGPLGRGGRRSQPPARQLRHQQRRQWQRCRYRRRQRQGAVAAAPCDDPAGHPVPLGWQQPGQRFRLQRPGRLRVPLRPRLRAAARLARDGPR